MENPTPAKHENLATIRYRKIRANYGISDILHLPGGQRILTYSSNNGSFQVWDMERDTQFGEEWVDKEMEVAIIALSPDGKKVATGSADGTVKLWSIDTGKVIKTLTGHPKKVDSLCWSPDGGRVVGADGSWYGNFRVWDVESGETIVGPIKAGEYMQAVCYSPDGKMIATGGHSLKIWDANTGELLKTLQGYFTGLAWSSDGRALFAGRNGGLVKKFNTVTWTADIEMRERLSKIISYDAEDETSIDAISISPDINRCILARISPFDNTAVQLWNFETYQRIGTPLHHEPRVELISATFSADGKFLVTRCDYDHIYIWDVSAILKEAGLPSDNVVLCTFPPSYLVSKRIVWHAPLLCALQPSCEMSTRTHHARGNPSGSTQPAYTYVIPTGPLQVTESSSQQLPTTAATPICATLGPITREGILPAPLNLPIPMLFPLDHYRSQNHHRSNHPPLLRHPRDW